MAIDQDGRLMTELQGSGRDAIPLPPGPAITDNQWHSIGFVWDDVYRALYVDDVEVVKDASPQSVGSCDGGLHVGVDKDLTQDSYFSGLIDDIRIYNRAVRP